MCPHGVSVDTESCCLFLHPLGAHSHLLVSSSATGLPGRLLLCLSEDPLGAFLFSRGAGRAGESKQLCQLLQAAPAPVIRYLPSPEAGAVVRRSVLPCKASDACRAVLCMFSLLLQLASQERLDVKGQHSDTRVLLYLPCGQIDPVH